MGKRRRGMTEFGCEVWVMAAKRGITTIRDLGRRIEVHHDTVWNYLHGRTSVHSRFLKALDTGLGLTDEERHVLAQIFAWGQTKREPVAR
jgi:hypothetical protein